MISNIFSMARYTFVGNVRNKIFLVLILFGIILLSSAVLLSVLGQEQELRIFMDLGAAAIEVLALFTAIFIMVNLVLEQAEQRTIYLVLTRSISRFEYLLGSYLGTLSAIFSCVAVMTALHVLLLLWKGWPIRAEGFLYGATILMSFEKIILISALGLFFSLFSSSGVVALVFTFFFWILGHFAVELKFLSARLQEGLLKSMFKAIYYLIPHFQYLNAKDVWISYPDKFGRLALESSLYTLLYSSAALALAVMVFRKKEF